MKIQHNGLLKTLKTQQAYIDKQEKERAKLTKTVAILRKQKGLGTAGDE